MKQQQKCNYFFLKDNDLLIKISKPESYYKTNIREPKQIHNLHNQYPTNQKSHQKLKTKIPEKAKHKNGIKAPQPKTSIFQLNSPCKIMKGLKTSRTKV